MSYLSELNPVVEQQMRSVIQDAYVPLSCLLYPSQLLPPFLMKQTVHTPCPSSPPNRNFGYSMRSQTTSPSLLSPSSPTPFSCPVNHLTNSASVQLQLVTTKKPPFRTNFLATIGYRSHTLLRIVRESLSLTPTGADAASLSSSSTTSSAESETASNVPLSRTISNPPWWYGNQSTDKFSSDSDNN